MNQEAYNNLATQLKQSINIGQDKVEDHVNNYIEGLKDSLGVASGGIVEDGLENIVHGLIRKGKKITEDVVRKGVDKAKDTINNARDNINNAISSKLETGNSILDETRNKINNVVGESQRPTPAPRPAVGAREVVERPAIPERRVQLSEEQPARDITFRPAVPERTVIDRPAIPERTSILTPAQAERTEVVRPATAPRTEKIPNPHPARSQVGEKENYKNVNETNLDEIENRVQTRFNNLDGKAQRRSDKSFRGNSKYTESPETFKDRLRNVKIREKTIANQEKNPKTTFKDTDLKVNPSEPANPDDIFGKVATERNPPKFDNPPETTTSVRAGVPAESRTIPAVTERTATTPAQPAITRTIPAEEEQIISVPSVPARFQVTEAQPAVSRTLPPVAASRPEVDDNLFKTLSSKVQQDNADAQAKYQAAIKPSEGEKVASDITKGVETEEKVGAEEGEDLTPEGLLGQMILGIGGGIASQFINSHKQDIVKPEQVNYSIAMGS